MAEASVRVRGLCHLALRVRDAHASAAFYRDHFGLREVWTPDRHNVYLSSGADNLALHEAPDLTPGGALDHLGFVVDSAEEVRAAAERLRARGVAIADEPRTHRDGSVSFSCRDPDGNLVQVIWLPG